MVPSTPIPTCKLSLVCKIHFLRETKAISRKNYLLGGGTFLLNQDGLEMKVEEHAMYLLVFILE